MITKEMMFAFRDASAGAISHIGQAFGFQPGHFEALLTFFQKDQEERLKVMLEQFPEQAKFYTDGLKLLQESERNERPTDSKKTH